MNYVLYKKNGILHCLPFNSPMVKDYLHDRSTCFESLGTETLEMIFKFHHADLPNYQSSWLENIPQKTANIAKSALQSYAMLIIPFTMTITNSLKTFSTTWKKTNYLYVYIRILNYGICDGSCLIEARRRESILCNDLDKQSVYQL